MVMRQVRSGQVRSGFISSVEAVVVEGRNRLNLMHESLRHMYVFQPVHMPADGYCPKDMFIQDRHALKNNSDCNRVRTIH